MRAARAGRAGAAVATFAAVLASAVACSGHHLLSADTVTGNGGRITRVLVDGRAYPAVRAEFEPFLNRKPGRVGAGAGTDGDIVATVKDGQAIDVVVLPAGSDLDRVRDELVVPPAPIGSLGPVTYWAGAVSSRGMSFVAFLTGRAGQRGLRAAGFR